jgi:hypothetical protein
MNKNKTPTQLMIEAASLRSEPAHRAEWQRAIEELARLVAESLVTQIPPGAEGELRTWLRTREGAHALRESWPRAVEAYLARQVAESDLTS